mgnify:CR=1 FL=1
MDSGKDALVLTARLLQLAQPKLELDIVGVLCGGLCSGNFCGFGRKKGKQNKVQGRCRYDHQHGDLFLFLKSFKKLGVPDLALTEGVMLSALKFRRIMPWSVCLPFNRTCTIPCPASCLGCD